MAKVDPLFDFGSTLRAYRAAKAWTQTELAERAGMSRQAISNLENSRSVPRRRTLEVLQKVFGLPFWAMDGFERDMVQPGPPFFILPWPPQGITWQEVQIAIVDYCTTRKNLVEQRAKESRRVGESFHEAVYRESKKVLRLRAPEKGSAEDHTKKTPRRKDRRK